MNEKLQYASMLEIPTTSCHVTFKPIKKKRGKKKDVSPEAVKQTLLDKVNSSAEEGVLEDGETSATALIPMGVEENESAVSTAVVKKERKPFKFSVVTVQLAVVALLIGVIAITNALNANSGINVFMRSLFSPTTPTIVDEREFNEFSPVIAMGEEFVLAENGVLTVSGEGSVYSPCDGKIASVTSAEDGSYTVEIAHSENFSTLISGLNFVYMAEGESVYSNIPVGYMGEFNATLCFLGADGAVITGYEIVDNSVVWAV